MEIIAFVKNIITKDIVTLCSTILFSFLGIYYIRANHKINKDQTFKDLFREFNKRFDDLNNSLNDIVIGSFDTRYEKKIIQDYLNLCSEEYLWRKKKRIDKLVWESWRSGIVDYMIESPKIKGYFFEEYQKGYDKSYYGFLGYIVKYVSNG